jgi:integrase
MGYSMKLTKKNIDKLPMSMNNRKDYFDSELKGFGIRVSRKSKKFFVLKRLKGKLTRVMLKPYGIVTPDQARKDAQKILSKLHDGIDINAEKAKDKIRGMKVSEALSQYLETKEHKDNTVKTYEYLFNKYLPDWLKRPIKEITKDMVASRHRKITEQNGRASANNVMRTFRAVYNFANELHDDELPQNPVKRLSNTGQWNKIERRQTVIAERELPLVFEAINKLENPIIRDYLLLLLFTGARRTEMACLKWENVDMDEKTFTLTVTKSGRPLILPMSDFIYGVFERRLAERVNDFVFPGTGISGHIIEPRKAIAVIKEHTLKSRNEIKDEAELERRISAGEELKPGISFCPHDLRRTFTSAISGTVAGGYELKRLLNHSFGNDVTAGYIIHSIEKLRILMQEATDHMLKLCKAHSR